MTPAGARMLGYTRVSTRGQSEDGHGLGAQEAAIRDECERKGWALVDVVQETGSGRSTTKRPGLTEAMARVERGEADGIIASKLDRLTRSIVDFGHILERATEHGWRLLVLDFDLDTRTAVGRMVANIVVAVAQFEAERIGERTRDGLAEARTKGARLGRPRAVAESVVERITEERNAGRSWPQIAAALNADRVPTPHQKAEGDAKRHRWYPTTCRRIGLAASQGAAVLEAS